MADLTSGGKAVPGFLWPGLLESGHWKAPAFSTVYTLNNADKRCGFVGYVRWPDGGTHNIAKVGFRAGAVTAGTGSTFKVALQNVDTANGPPGRGDGTDDQVYTSTTIPTANAYQEVTLGATRSAAHGSMLAVDFGLSIFGVGTSVVINGLSTDISTFVEILTAGAYLRSDATTYATVVSNPNIVFVSDDATPVYGTLHGSAVLSAVNSHTFNNTSDPKIYLCRIVTNIEMTIDGLWCVINPVGSANDFDLMLYNSVGSALETISIDANTNAQHQSRLFLAPLTTQRTLAAGTYYVGVKPTTANNVTCYSVDVSAAKILDCLIGGADCTYATISAADVLSAATTTRRFMAGLHVTGVATAASGGGRRSRAQRHGV